MWKVRQVTSNFNRPIQRLARGLLQRGLSSPRWGFVANSAGASLGPTTNCKSKARVAKGKVVFKIPGLGKLKKGPYRLVVGGGEGTSKKIRIRG
jgi:hypothetical protein